MSLETHSTKRNRVYRRAFDHDEARKLRAEGWSYSRLADHFGVSATAVQRVCDPEFRAKLDARSLAHARANRKPCRGGCGTLVWDHGDRTGYCTACWGAVRSAPNEREGELRCTRCGEWGPDEQFGRDTRRKTRRGRRTYCRACEAEARRDHRRRKPEQERAATNRQHREVAKRKGTARMSEYIVLRKNGNGWNEVGKVEASSVLYAVEEGADGEGIYTAVKPAQIMAVEPTTAFKVVKGA